MIDMVPKAITLTLVNHSKENLQRELLQELYKPEVLDELLKESEYVVNRRKEVVSMLQALNKAEECVPRFVSLPAPSAVLTSPTPSPSRPAGSWRACERRSAASLFLVRTAEEGGLGGRWAVGCACRACFP